MNLKWKQVHVIWLRFQKPSHKPTNFVGAEIDMLKLVNLELVNLHQRLVQWLILAKV